MEKWHRRYEKARSLPARALFGVLREKAVKQVDRATFRVRSLLPGYPSDLALQKALHLTRPFDAFLDDSFPAYENFFLTEQEKEEVVYRTKEDFDEWTKVLITKAEGALRHRFGLLGARIETGPRIDWQMDYASGYSWPCRYSRKIPKVIPDNQSDIKYPWELSRFHHGVLLGRAFALTGDERYAREYFAQFRGWMIENPPGYGVNWICTMEVAIRAANVIWSFFFFKTSVLFDRGLKILLLKFMLAHGRFIFKNLELNRMFVEGRFQPINGNHYVADLAGLLYISLMFPEFRESETWFEKAWEELIGEIDRQVMKDGVHHELSPNYHRLVLEMFLSSLLLLVKHGVAVPVEAWRTLEKMFEYIHYYTKPDQSVPLIRDIDNGRFHILGDDALTSHTHLLPVGAILFSRPLLVGSHVSEDAFWLLGPDSIDRFRAVQEGGERPAPTSKAFPEGGTYLLRQNDLYMLALCSPVGLKGVNGHAHNDFLSFDLFAYDKTFLTDCGSFVYTRDQTWRNRFRSTRSHNTAVIDGREINPFCEQETFTLKSDATLHVDRWASDEGLDCLDARYELGPGTSTGVVHRRRFLFVKGSEGDSYWVIQDRFEGPATGRRHIDIRFHFNTGIMVAVEDGLSLRTVCERGANLVLIPLSHPDMFSLAIDTGWMSAIYAEKRKISVAKYSYAGRLPAAMTYLLYPVPHSEERTDRFPRISSRHDFTMVREKGPAIMVKLEALGQ